MMTTTVDEGSSKIMDDLFGADEEHDDVYLDLDSFWEVMGGPPPESSEHCTGDPPSVPALEGLVDPDEKFSPSVDLRGYGALSPLYNSETSDSKVVLSDLFPDTVGNSVAVDCERLEPSSQLSSAEQSCSRGTDDFMHVQDGGYQSASPYGQVPSQKAPFGMPTPRDASGFHLADHVIHGQEFSELFHSNLEKDLFQPPGADACSKNIYHMKPLGDANIGTSSARGIRTSPEASHAESNSCEISSEDIPDFLSENGSLSLLSSDDAPHFSYSSELKSLASDDDRMLDIVDEGIYPTEGFSMIMPHEDLVGGEFGQSYAYYGSCTPVSVGSNIGATQVSHLQTLRNESKNLSSNVVLNVFEKAQDDVKVENKFESVVSNDYVSRASVVIDDVMSRNFFRAGGQQPAAECTQWSSSNSSSSISYKNYVHCAKDEKEDIFYESKRAMLSLADAPSRKSSLLDHDLQPVLRVSGHSGVLASSSHKAELNGLKMENEVHKVNFDSLNIGYNVVQSNSVEQSNAEDDPDVCILEDRSAPAPVNPNLALMKFSAASQISKLRDQASQMATGISKLRSNDERVIFRVALQDLSQPRIEAYPPAGLLAVPLLKHQRIALSWMINKETRNACCAGGILADDQGLGKTVSTISLILKERSSTKAPTTHEEQSETEMLNLDEDETGGSETYCVDAGSRTRQSNQCGNNSGKICSPVKGRPPGGTLIVCPTSVLRQWSEELHNKVTSEADLSVLVYHGSNRTKDPIELAKYDVVVTTYAIVSMEVPKQPVVNEDDPSGFPSKGFSSSKKRKQLENMPYKKTTSKKSKKGVDNELAETISGALAKVGWFRIVLDEAQIIKNHRTQVARACWGLRAKRRWCLSGTPIQNAIDDLYSYFRFLRYEPYATYKTFCEQLKAPIQWSPRDGYKKLQAVLKTIMLRRTKSTVIDGEPIINLPPKTIELKRVDFSKEERDFYCNLEADSRAQFAVYAREGTVKQNYVNILLMLLRLRQACDHPLLVRGFNSNSEVSSSLEMAKKLPQEKRSFLLSCLEGRLAICGICNDPPEDAVVTICGHVFCNQCICENMIGDGTQCPIKNCKTHLTISYLFSIPTLRMALSDQLSIENTQNFCDSEIAKVSEPCRPSSPQESSKIKAALELLLSLSKPQGCASGTSVLESPDGDSGEENGIVAVNGHSDKSVRVAGEKAIVFSQWTRMLDLLEDCLKSSSIQYRRLDGTMPVVARDRAVKDFNSLPQVSVMIMSLKAASLGLNMVAACHVLLLDLWWNPTTEDQAIDRAHRIGQTRPVSVFRLTVKDTVEDRILALQQRKREMVASAFGEDETGSRQTRLTVEDLKYLFRV